MALIVWCLRSFLKKIVFLMLVILLIARIGKWILFLLE